MILWYYGIIASWHHGSHGSYGMSWYHIMVVMVSWHHIEEWELFPKCYKTEKQITLLYFNARQNTFQQTSREINVKELFKTSKIKVYLLKRVTTILIDILAGKCQVDRQRTSWIFTQTPRLEVWLTIVVFKLMGATKKITNFFRNRWSSFRPKFLATFENFAEKFRSCVRPRK